MDVQDTDKKVYAHKVSLVLRLGKLGLLPPLFRAIEDVMTSEAEKL
jgi:hypothetical protein